MRLIPILLWAIAGHAAEFPTAIRTTEIARVSGSLTQVTNAGDGSGRLFAVEQSGQIFIIKDGVAVARPFLDIRSRVLAGGERGLLSVAFPPDCRLKRHFYVNYTDRPGGNTVVARYRVTEDPDFADPATEDILLRIVQPFANHNGGMMAFGPRDGRLYIGMGDGGSGGDPQNNAQNPQSLLGKMLRLDTEDLTQRPQPEIWATGLRNPWRFSFDRETGDLWIADVGQGRWEEVNFQPAASRGGENYGWRRMEGSHCYEANCSSEGLVMPVFEYDHSGGSCSVTGGYAYRGAQYPALRGVYFFADYCSGSVWASRAVSSGFETRLLTKLDLNITSFGEDERGELLIADAGGRVFRINAEVAAVAVLQLGIGGSGRAGLVPGSIAVASAAGLTRAETPVHASSFPLPVAMAGISVTINGIAAPLFGITRSQDGQHVVVFQVPWGLTPGSRVGVTAGDAAPAETDIVEANPAIFAVVRHARHISIWATGLGVVDIAQADGAPGPLDPLARTRVVPEVSIGGRSARVLFSGLAPGFAGLYQIEVELPDNTPAGEPVVVKVGDAQSNPVAI